MKNLIIISAPSGSGKTTLCRALQKQDKSICFSVSCTTREQRNGEIDGVDYSFLSIPAAVRAAAALPKASTIKTPGITGFPGKCPWTKKESFLTFTIAVADFK